MERGYDGEICALKGFDVRCELEWDGGGEVMVYGKE